jgi:hypothetical protein
MRGFHHSSSSDSSSSVSSGSSSSNPYLICSFPPYLSKADPIEQGAHNQFCNTARAKLRKGQDEKKAFCG